MKFTLVQSFKRQKGISVQVGMKLILPPPLPNLFLQPLCLECLEAKKTAKLLWKNNALIPRPNLSICFCCSVNSRTYRTVLSKSLFMSSRSRRAGAVGEIELKSWYIKILCHPMEFQEFFHLQYLILQKDINGHSSTNNSFSAHYLIFFFFSCVCGGRILNSLSIPKNLLTYFKICICKEPCNQSIADSFRKAEETLLTYWNSG